MKKNYSYKVLRKKEIMWTMYVHLCEDTHIQTYVFLS